MNIYRVDPSGKVEVAVPSSGLGPNGLCFSPDYTKSMPSARRIFVGDIQGKKPPISPFTDCMVDGVRCGPDGMRADRPATSGQLVRAAGLLRRDGMDPAGKLIGRIRLRKAAPISASAGQARPSVHDRDQSLYMLRVNIQGRRPLS